ncbi:MAG: Cna B-type domain-containing protein, partial [Christensenellales bacterium]|nr:Cna B-type domain-containing protein [Christensenellales bacterium]
TNTIIDPNNVTVSGTKTWVDGGQTHDNADELTLTLTRTSAKQGAKPETVAVVPAWEGNTYTFTNLEQYDAEGYAYTYDVTEAPVQGYTTAQNGYDFTNTIIDPNNVTVSGTKTWVDGGQTHNNADELTLTLTRTSAKQGAKPETVAVVPTWEGNTYTFTNLEQYDAEGYAYVYSVVESEVQGYTTTQNGYDFTNTITQEKRTITGTKTWTDGAENHTQDQIALTLYRQANGSGWAKVEAEPVWQGWTYTFANLDRYDANGYEYAYKVEESTVPGVYTAAYAPADGVAVFENNAATVNITNTLKLVGGDGRLTVTKTWEDKGGDPKDRPKVSFQLLNGDGTPAKKDGQDWIVPLDTATDTAVFENVPLRMDGYIVKELIDSTTNTYGYVADAQQKAVPADGTTAAFTNTRTIASVTVTKHVVDETTDSAAGLAQKFTFELNGERSQPVGNGERASFMVEIGKTYSLTELDANGNPLPSGVWSTTGLGTYTVETANLAIDVINTRTLYGRDGDVTVTKTWLDGDGKPLADALIPEQIDVRLYEGANATGATATLNRENGWKATWSHLPAYALDGTALVYSVKETVDGADYGDGAMVMIGERKFAVSMNGFAITNALENSEPTRPEKSADEVSMEGVQPGDPVTYTIRRTSHLGTTSTATVTDRLPVALDFVSTDSVKVNGEKRNLKATVQGKTATWTIQNVPPMGTIEVVFTARVTEDAMDVDVIANKATVDLGDKNDSQFESNVVPIPVARLILSKSAKLPAGKDKAALGDPIDYTITLRNAGEVVLSDVTIRDAMLERADGDVLVNGSAVKFEGQTIRLDELWQKKTATVTYRVIVTEEDILNGTVDNTATANAKFGRDKALPEQEAKTSTPTEPKNGHLKVEKRTVSQPKDEKGYVLGETIRYEIVVTNDGNLTIADIKVTDSLSSAKDKVIGTIKSLAPGASETFAFEHKVTEADILAGKVVNEATATGKSPDPEKPEVPVDPGETEDKTEPKKGHLKVEKRTVSQPKDKNGYRPGETIRYEIKVTNDGNLTITDIKVTDSLSSAKDKVIGTIKSLAPGASETFAFE